MLPALPILKKGFFASFCTWKCVFAVWISACSCAMLTWFWSLFLLTCSFISHLYHTFSTPKFNQHFNSSAALVCILPCFCPLQLHHFTSIYLHMRTSLKRDLFFNNSLQLSVILYLSWKNHLLTPLKKSVLSSSYTSIQTRASYNAVSVSHIQYSNTIYTR